MNLAQMGVAAALALAIYAAPFSYEGDPDPMIVAAFDATQPGEQRFSLQASGRDTGCLVTAASADDGKQPLSLASACLDLVPGLAGARWWLEREDGTVAFAADNGKVVAEFALADGVAYESYAPRQPIMTLLSR